MPVEITKGRYSPGMSIPPENPAPNETATHIVERRERALEARGGKSDSKKNTDAVWQTLKDLAYKIDHPDGR
jgi:hypothetical protein